LIVSCEKDKNFNELLFVIKPTLEDYINSPDFIISSENKENVLILQFFAKFFR
jgi:hypothetical protein